MKIISSQAETWSGAFGQAYTERNCISMSDAEQYYLNNFGITRKEMNLKFLGHLDRKVRILEVGSNVCLELQLLQEMGFENLYGIELQAGAVDLAQKRTSGINVIQGTAFDIPFKDAYFDVVFTSGVLIHIHPENHESIMEEMYRCTKKYIWGFEYYAEKTEKIAYRGHDSLMWKADYSGLFQKQCKGLCLVKQKLYTYLDNENVDCMYLMEKI